jgi:hypothetical protein
MCRHFSATAEEQVTELLKRVKELTGMPDLATASFQLILCTSNPLAFCVSNFKSFASLFF